MSIKRFSFNETPFYKEGTAVFLESTGFIVSLGLFHETSLNRITVKKGSLVFGFNDGRGVYGYVIDSDESHDLGPITGTAYLIMYKTGQITLVSGAFSGIRGIGANVEGIPWYTYGGAALIGKVIRTYNKVNPVVCEDPFWCEFEGVF